MALGLALLAGPNSVPVPVEIPPLEVASTNVGLTRQGALQLWQGVPLSGSVIEREGARVVAHTPYWQGRREGLAQAWHPNGQLAWQRLYHRDWRSGTHRGWWPNGRLQFERHYRNDRFEGDQRAWFANGALFEVGHFVDGREEGRQSQYADDGRIVANYVVKDGRRYGVVGRFDCTSVGRH